MTYHVNEVFYTIQGEGFWTGRAAVFCRFSRCNLWTGREEDRARAICKFCDTDFLSASKFELDELVEAIKMAWPDKAPNPMVVFTGGEPMLQLDRQLAYKLRQCHGFYVAVETNGTIKQRPDNIDWVCVSPKVNATLQIHEGDELKLVYPQGPDPSPYLGLKFDHFWLSPMDGPNLEENTHLAVEYVQQNPAWRLNIQTHKVVGVR